ncbi:hypothetical protein I4U23_006362 [Adineta vaga]|nr:hypothetical protein I4U23_006362 [Adineta vaga]
MTNLNNTSTLITTLVSLEEYAPYYYQFRRIHRLLVKITFPYLFFISFIGLITNTLTVILLLKNNVTKNLKNKWTLIALALSDLLFNTVLLIRGIHDIFKGKSDRICLTISFLSHLAEVLSAYYTVSFTIQRYYAIRCPFEAAVRRRSSPIVSLLVIFILSSIFCFHLSYYNRYEDCHEELDLNWFLADALISFVIPFILILIFNIMIVNYIRKHSYIPVSFQRTFFSKKKSSNLDDIYETETNTGTVLTTAFSQIDGNEHFEMKPSNDSDRLSSLKRANSETSSSLPNRSRSDVLFKKNFYARRQISLDSFSTRTSKQSNRNESISKLSTRSSQSLRVTRMLILVSSCFLLLNAPGHLFILTLKIYINLNSSLPNEHIIHNITSNQTIILLSQTETTITNNDQLAIHVLYTAILFTQLLAYASYSINFFLYSFSGIAFRTNLRQLMKKIRRHR